MPDPLGDLAETPRPMAPGTSGAPVDDAAFAIVPRAPGALIRPSAPERERDELDEAIDELFGETTDEEPGRLDVVLIVGGLLLFAWAWLTGASVAFIVVAGLLLLLGLALPARAGLRSVHRRQLAAARRRSAAEGLPLAIDDPHVAALAAAYEEATTAAAASASDLAAPSVSAAHLAVLEAASLLEGAPPIGEADARYVDDRTEAIRRIAHRLEATPRRSDGHIDRRFADRRAAVRVRQDLEAASGLSGLGRLERIETRLDQEVRPEPDR